MLYSKLAKIFNFFFEGAYTEGLPQKQNPTKKEKQVLKGLDELDKLMDVECKRLIEHAELGGFQKLIGSEWPDVYKKINEREELLIKFDEFSFLYIVTRYEIDEDEKLIPIKTLSKHKDFEQALKTANKYFKELNSKN